MASSLLVAQIYTTFPCHIFRRCIRPNRSSIQLFQNATAVANLSSGSDESAMGTEEVKNAQWCFDALTRYPGYEAKPETTQHCVVQPWVTWVYTCMNMTHNVTVSACQTDMPSQWCAPAGSIRQSRYPYQLALLGLVIFAVVFGTVALVCTYAECLLCCAAVHDWRKKSPHGISPHLSVTTRSSRRSLIMTSRNDT